MDTRPVNKPETIEKSALSAWLIEFLERLIPNSDFASISALLRTRRDTISYVTAFAKLIPPKLTGAMRAAFDTRKVLGETCWLCIAFIGAIEFWRPMAAVILVALIALRIRDGFIHPAEGLPPEAATDGLAMAGAIGLSQVFFLVAFPSLVMPSQPLAQGIALGMVLVSVWRLFFHLNTPKNDPQKLPGSGLYRKSLRIVAMWAVACAGLAYTNSLELSDNDVVQFFAQALPFAFAGIAYRHSIGGRSIFWEEPAPLSITKDPNEKAVERQRDSLPAIHPKKSDTVIKVCFEIATCLVLVSSVPVGLWRWFTGNGVVHWAQILSKVVAMIALAVLWRKIEHLNRGTAKYLDEQTKKNRSD
jgi:hypothetical protein